jgi:hypothetical protein
MGRTARRLKAPSFRLPWIASLGQFKEGKLRGSIRTPPGTPFARLHRERPAHNPIRNNDVEILFALDAWNRLTSHLCKSSTGANMNFLLVRDIRARPYVPL